MVLGGEDAGDAGAAHAEGGGRLRVEGDRRCGGGARLVVRGFCAGIRARAEAGSTHKTMNAGVMVLRGVCAGVRARAEGGSAHARSCSRARARCSAE